MSIIPFSLVEVQQNTKMRLTSMPFLSLTGVAINPDVVTLTVRPPGVAATVYTWTNPTGDPTGTIIHDSTGNFHADIDNSVGGPGIWEWWFAGAPGTSGLDTTKTKIEQVHQSILVLS